MKKVLVLERSQHIAASPEETFEFFSDPRNLASLTPPWLDFKILEAPASGLREGSEIRYQLKIHRIPVRWTTRIDRWEPGEGFVDVQESGPYALWEHHHRFVPTRRGTRIDDTVRYALPFGIVGLLGHSLFVRRDIEQIFDFRTEQVARLLA